MPVNRDAALMIARARAPTGEVAMTEIMMLSVALIEACDELDRLRAIAAAKGVVSGVATNANDIATKE